MNFILLSLIEFKIKAFSKKYYSPNWVDYPYIYSNISLLHLILLNYSIYITKIIEINVVFIPSSILRLTLLRGMILGTQGTILSANLALERKSVVHIGGGLHHAHFKGGSGFCTYNDIGLACKYLLDFHSSRVEKILIIDLDAHQGNGHERDKELLGDHLIIADMYNPNIFPHDNYAKKFINYSREVTRETNSREYLLILEELLHNIEK